MSPGLHEFAEKLEIMPLLMRLADKQHPPSRLEAMALQDQIDDVILESYFDAAAFMGECEREQTRLETFRERLLASRDRRVEVNNAVNFISSGTLNTVGSALSMPVHADNITSNINQLVAGVVSTGLSGFALRENHGGKTHGWSKPTVLAELFGRPTDVLTRYPESVWRFFHCSMPGSPGMTRMQWLESFWLAREHIEPSGSLRQKHKLDIVCGVPSRRKDVSIDDVSDQIDMIADVTIATSQMIMALRNLLSIAHYEPVRLRHQIEELSGKSTGTAEAEPDNSETRPSEFER